MPKVNLSNGDNTGAFQANPDDILAASPQFYAARDAIREAANTLHTTLTGAIAAFDGDTHKKLQTLGDNSGTNLQGLANAMEEIAIRLNQTSAAIQKTEGHNTRMF